MTDERTFANAPASIPQARRYTLHALAGVADEVADAAALMVSELATNSVRHAATEFTVSIDRDPGGFRIAVTDAGEHQPTLKSPGPREHSGRGLQIVSALADEWGVSEMVDRAGKTVWFVLAAGTNRSRGGRGSGTKRVAVDGADHSPATPPQTAPRKRSTERREQASAGRHPGGDRRRRRRRATDRRTAPGCRRRHRDSRRTRRRPPGRTSSLDRCARY